MTKLAIPTVHMNGTSREALRSALEGAMAALFAAEKAMAEVTPNGRDYYVQGSEAIGEALRQHRARVAKIGEVLADLEEIAEAIA